MSVWWLLLIVPVALTILCYIPACVLSGRISRAEEVREINLIISNTERGEGK